MGLGQGTNKLPGPHQGQPVLAAGEPLERAKAAMILIHGRGASAEDILSLATEVNQPGFLYLAPQAAGYSWYPQSFLAPLASNEPGLSSGLAVIAALFERLTDAGIGPEGTILLGFSQGACLSLEFASRNARRYGGVVGLSGGLIGPAGTKWDYPGSLQGTPVFLGCSGGICIFLKNGCSCLHRSSSSREGRSSCGSTHTWVIPSTMMNWRRSEP